VGVGVRLGCFSLAVNRRLLYHTRSMSNDDQARRVVPKETKVKQKVLAAGFVAVNSIGLTVAIATSPFLVPLVKNWLTPIKWPTVMALLPTAIAALLPIFSTGYFSFVHKLDERCCLRGLSSHAKSKESRDCKSWDYADSAILRQSIHALLAVALIVALFPDSEHRSATETFMAFLAGSALAVSTALSLVSVLCYGYSKRWHVIKEDPFTISHALLDRGFLLDKPSWYFLILGLVWLPAVKYPVGSILTNLLFGWCLYFYYFERRGPEGIGQSKPDPCAQLAGYQASSATQCVQPTEREKGSPGHAAGNPATSSGKF
jgi:hypothetical protein